jgi:NAD(P)-dependent dehydrogenase (short-subunit alcohol dehydrogenase family)
VAGLLAGKVAVVSGSTKGLGASIARRFHEEGAKVVLSGRSREKGEKLATRLGKGARYVPTDLAKVEECRGLVKAAIEAFGGVDVLVNSAALTARSTLESFTPELFDEQLHVNVRAPLLLAQAALPSLRARRGTILNVGSVNAYVGWPNLLVYAASKSALMTASRNLANALKYARVRVFCLNLGWVDTEGERELMARLGKPKDFLDREGKRYPVGRLIRPEEVAEVCLLLASDKAAAFSGAVIDLEQFPIGSLHHPASDGDPQA